MSSNNIPDTRETRSLLKMLGPEWEITNYVVIEGQKLRNLRKRRPYAAKFQATVANYRLHQFEVYFHMGHGVWHQNGDDGWHRNGSDQTEVLIFELFNQRNHAENTIKYMLEHLIGKRDGKLLPTNYQRFDSAQALAELRGYHADQAVR